MSDDNDLLGSNLDPLDHDGNGAKGGSLKGEKSTRAKGAAKKKGVAVQATEDPDSTWIILDENDDIPPSGLPLSVNGEAIMILPSVPVKVPNRYIEVLDNAVIAKPVIDPVTRQPIDWRPQPRFPYRRVSAPREE